MAGPEEIMVLISKLVQGSVKKMQTACSMKSRTSEQQSWLKQVFVFFMDSPTQYMHYPSAP